MFDRDGRLERHWLGWLLAAIGAFAAFTLMPAALTRAGLQLAPRQNSIEAALWVASCVTIGFAALALFSAKVTRPNALMASLSRCAYAIYLVHYVVVWLQHVLSPAGIPAGIKFIICTALAVSISWALARIALSMLVPSQTLGRTSPI